MLKVREENYYGLTFEKPNPPIIREIYVKRYGYKIGNTMAFIECLIDNSTILFVLFVVIPTILDIGLIAYTIWVNLFVFQFVLVCTLIISAIYMSICFIMKDIPNAYRIAKENNPKKHET